MIFSFLLKMLQLMMAEGIAKGIVKPLSRLVYTPVDISKAFRLLSLKRHSGNVVIRMKDFHDSSKGLNVTPKCVIIMKYVIDLLTISLPVV